MENEINKRIREILKIAYRENLYPEIKAIEKGLSSEPEFEVDGKKVLSFCSFNFLGLANDPLVKKAIIEGINKYGAHPCGAVLISGTLGIHKKLEKEIAAFLGKEDAMIYNTTSMANIGVIPAIANLPLSTLFSFFKIPFREDEEVILLSDELNHATIVEGCRLAKGKKIIYKHCDVKDLESQLKKHKKNKRKIILTDGVFSMDGDIAPLKEIASLAKEHGALIYVDDVNALGVLGDKGAGTAEYLGLKDIDIITTGFSKCFGVTGGITAASKDTIDYLRVTSKTYIFSGGILGGLAQGVLKSLEIVKKDKDRRNRLWENTRYLKNGLVKIGFNILKTETPIIPILIGSERISINMAKDLLERNIFSPPIRWPAVSHGQARMRFVVNSTHTKKQIDYLLENLTTIGRKYKII